MTAAHVTGAQSPRHRRARRGHHRLLWLPLVVFAGVASMAFIYVVYVLWPRWAGPPSDVIPHVFERFYRADPARSATEGVGLGLSLAKWIVDRHSGVIEASSGLP